MASKLLTGYKIIKGTKKTYKTGLKRAYQKYLKYVFDEKGDLKKGIIAKTVAPDFKSFSESILSRANEEIAKKNKALKELGKPLKKYFTKRNIRFTKKQLTEILRSTKYRSDLSTAKAFMEKIKEYDEDAEYSIHQLRKMETQEIANILADDIKKEYHKLMAEKGKGHSREVAAKIAEMYFGS